MRLTARLARALDGADEIRHRMHLHLFHDTSAMDLDRLLHGSQIAGDLLVERAGDHVIKHLAFAGRQRGETRFDASQVRTFDRAPAWSENPRRRLSSPRRCPGHRRGR